MEHELHQKLEYIETLLTEISQELGILDENGEYIPPNERQQPQEEQEQTQEEETNHMKKNSQAIPTNKR